ncbi:hypothetical protein [Sphingomonas immobilis]|uniref:Minor tail protein n=1 Tax=Sphingomonas immobilis TaxID=3063997 RepID=A0ABT8ZUX4_9SPHN|nr:hypothetical protein [Sphingomonas sp. CA1-15]MDO7841068.1 hypothetical protein [Sphingomonas sp. CA1-15]
MTATFEYLADQQVIFEIEGADLLGPLVERAEDAAAAAEGAVGDAEAQVAAATTQAGNAAASALQAAAVVTGFGRSRYGNTRDTNYSSNANPPTQNADGTWKSTTNAPLNWAMNATDDFAIGNTVIWATRQPLGYGSTPPAIVFQNSGGGTISTITAAAADANGYRAASATIPANTATLLFQTSTTAAGNDFEAVIVANATSDAMARKVQRSRVPLVLRQSVEGNPKRLVGRGQATVATEALTGDPGLYRKVLASRGGAVNAASLNAWAAFWAVMVAERIDEDLAAAFPFLGTTLAARFVPALDRYGYGELVAPSSFTSAAAEGDGLTGTVTLDTGIPAEIMSPYGCMLAADVLNDVTGSGQVVGDTWGLTPEFATFAIYDRGIVGGSRTQGQSRTPYGTSSGIAYTNHTVGLFCGSSLSDGSGYLTYDGDMIGVQPAAPAVDAMPSGNILIRPGPCALGLVLIGNKPFDPWKHTIIATEARKFRKAVRVGVPLTEGDF